MKRWTCVLSASVLVVCFSGGAGRAAQGIAPIPSTSTTGTVGKGKEQKKSAVDWAKVPNPKAPPQDILKMTLSNSEAIPLQWPFQANNVSVTLDTGDLGHKPKPIPPDPDKLRAQLATS